jgi:hypothetical protein
MKCKGCSGKGKYTGLRFIEDPCSRCGGSGQEPENVIETGPQLIDDWFIHSGAGTKPTGYNNASELVTTKRLEFIGVSYDTGRFYIFADGGNLREVTQSYMRGSIEAGIHEMTEQWGYWTQIDSAPEEVTKHGNFC